jgi:ABC-type multidrug transport system fused ATPase/permease subunit
MHDLLFDRQNSWAKQISIGDVTFHLRNLSDLQDLMSEILADIAWLNEKCLYLKDAYELMNMKPDIEDGYYIFPKLKVGPEIRFENVSFKYPGSERMVLKNLNLTIKPGEKIALVGHNGAGKSTLINLICRLYKTTQGSIHLNNINIDNIQIDTWYRNVGVLFQDYNCYTHLTVRENIYIGKPDEEIDEDRIVESAKNADALKFIEEFPTGFNQTLGERFKGGVRLSTGQWQKIAIARFFYRNAPLVIFDEPTAAIDAVSEYNIFNKIYEFFTDKTVIIVSHRFSTVRNADRIIVVDNGEIAEQGSHTELMAMNGKYAKAFLLQAEGYN